jgi:hypothetical protein
LIPILIIFGNDNNMTRKEKNLWRTTNKIRLRTDHCGAVRKFSLEGRRAPETETPDIRNCAKFGGHGF